MVAVVQYGLYVILRLVGAALLIGLGLGASAAGVLVYPQPLFSYSVAEGRLELRSDEPFDPAAGRRILREVKARIARSPLDDRRGTHRVVIANAGWRERLTFLWSYGAGGLNYFPLTRNVYLRRADVARDVLYGSIGPVPPPRTLSYFAAHEIAHSLTGERVGWRVYAAMPAWIREGVADDIGFGDRADLAALESAFLAGDHALDPRRSGLYARFRLLVLHFLEREGWTFDELLRSDMSEAEAEARLRAWIAAHGSGSSRP